MKMVRIFPILATFLCLVPIAASACKSRTIPPPHDVPAKPIESPIAADIVKVSPCEPETSPVINAKDFKRDAVAGGVLNAFVVCGMLPRFDAKVYQPGKLVVNIFIDTSGRPITVETTEKDKVLRDALLAAANGTKFSPRLLGGEPVRVRGLLVYAHTPEKGVWIPRSIPVRFEEERDHSTPTETQ